MAVSVLAPVEPVDDDRPQHVGFLLAPAQYHLLRLTVCEYYVLVSVHMDDAGHRLVE